MPNLETKPKTVFMTQHLQYSPSLKGKTLFSVELTCLSKMPGKSGGLLDFIEISGLFYRKYKFP